jgi:hypothetical protein
MKLQGGIYNSVNGFRISILLGMYSLFPHRFAVFEQNFRLLIRISTWKCYLNENDPFKFGLLIPNVLFLFWIKASLLRLFAFLLTINTLLKLINRLKRHFHMSKSWNLA